MKSSDFSHIVVKWGEQTIAIDTEKAFRLADPTNPHELLARMNEVPGRYAYYANVNREIRLDFSRAKADEVVAEAGVRALLGSNIEAKTGKPASAAAIDREFQVALDQAIKYPSNATDAMKRYIEIRKEAEQPFEESEKMAIIVEACRMHATMLRSMGSLIEPMLQQNMITPPRMTDADRIGSKTDDGIL